MDRAGQRRALARWRLVAVAALLTTTLAGCGATVRSVEITIRYSRFSPALVNVPAGVPITFRLRNEDPIDHEWIVGEEGLHAAHRTGTEAVHAARLNEITLPALETRTTVLSFDEPGQLEFICHLPGHEAYGMAGLLNVVP